jgi:hypothetical protein
VSVREVRAGNRGEWWSRDDLALADELSGVVSELFGGRICGGSTPESLTPQVSRPRALLHEKNSFPASHERRHCGSYNLERPLVAEELQRVPAHDTVIN